MKRVEILEKANEMIGGDRAEDYGSVKENFKCTADLWQVYIYELNRIRDDGGLILPHDVAILNILQKVSRLVNSPDHLDSWMDIAGYAALGGEITSE